jgi:tryptophanyl-tRNA synthetase
MATDEFITAFSLFKTRSDALHEQMLTLCDKYNKVPKKEKKALINTHKEKLAELKEELQKVAALFSITTDASFEPASQTINSDQLVTPWTTHCSTAGFQYDKLIEQFGVQPIQPLIDRFEQVIGQPVHPWVRRGLFFAHRQLEEILNDYEAGKPIFLYTGRGPTSDSLHLGHMIPFIFTKWLHDVFKNSILVIQIADDEKHYFKDLEFDEIERLALENVKDIIACGFDPKRTFIFSNRRMTKTDSAHQLIHNIYKKVNINKLANIFGLESTDNIGQHIWPVYQAAASFSKFYGSYEFLPTDARCLSIYAIDQDPYFRMSRELAEYKELGLIKPSAIMSQFLPALEGKAKMSSSVGGVAAIFMTDDPVKVQNSIKRHAFSGGRETLKEHRELGADLQVDISYQYLKYFEYDDAEFDRITEEYGSGRMLTSEVKNILINKVNAMIAEHKERRNAVTDADIEYFYDLNKI